MLIKLYQKKVFCWDELSNSSIHNKTIVSFPVEIAKINTRFVPQIGDKIEIDGNTYTIKMLTRHFGKRKNEKVFIDSYVDLYTESEFYSIGYTKYLVKYTHAYDKFKEDSDPTKDMSKVNDKVFLPSTLEEWIKIYNEMYPEQ